MDMTHNQTITLIRTFKKEESLWNTKLDTYRTKSSRNAAWENIQKITGFPIEVCKRKFESLLASCRREKIKIKRSKATADRPELIYKSKWIYWKELRFLRKQENIESDSSTNSEHEQDTPPSTSSLAHKSMKKRKSVLKVMLPSPNNLEYDNLTKTASVLSTKCSSSNVLEKDEHDMFGIMVATKLRKMEENQRLHAEHIINQALYKGLTFQLTSESETELIQVQQQQQQHQQQQQQQQLQQLQQQQHLLQHENTVFPIIVSEHSNDFKQIDIL